ncbi:phosphoglucosamine mutase [Pasteurella multocida subsp. multocida str. Anand1_buffalo]|nr:phosphoglucosamine mutase [Pasteurella multocida subsp. multocida str. Anand1_buffalo]
MAERKYFGTDGVRGKVGTFPITPDFALKLGWAAGKVLATQGSRTVLIGKDTRISGYMLESALEAGYGGWAFSGVHRTDANSGYCLFNTHISCRSGDRHLGIAQPLL